MVEGDEITEGNLNEIETDRDYGKSRSEGSKAIECEREITNTKAKLDDHSSEKRGLE